MRSPQGAPVTNVRRIAAFLAVVAALGAVAVATLGRRAPSAPDFALIDQHGAPFVLSAQRGRAVVLFFGYTHCPDVCPATMAVEQRAIRRLGARAGDVEIAFVTVDPERDDARALGRYAATFGPNVVALRGDDLALARAWTGYHVYHQAVARRPGETGYAVVHSSAVYYIARSGALAAYGDWSDAGDAVSVDLQKSLE